MTNGSPVRSDVNLTHHHPIHLLGIAAVALVLLTSSCTDDGPLPPDVEETAPVLEGLQPASGAPGDTVVATGQRFGAEQGDGRLLFGTIAAAIVGWSDTQVSGLVPANATSGPVTLVAASGEVSNEIVFLISTGSEPPPVLASLIPARTVAGDTLTIAGQDFGAEQGDALILFDDGAGGEVQAAAALEWADTGVRVLVPQGAGDGPVRVRTSGGDSNGLDFELAPRLISYMTDVDPLFGPANGCKSCHGGSGGLFLDTYANLMRGDSNHGPVVIPRQSGSSPLVLKLQDAPPFGQRMPLGGMPLSSTDITTIADWIDQGARDN